MNCVKEKELILFYYQELNPQRRRSIEEHINNCCLCSREYANIKSFLTDFKSEKLELTVQDYEKVSKYVLSQACQSDNYIFGQMKDFWLSLRRRLFYQPKLIPVLAVIVIMAGIFLFRGKNQTNENLDILQIELELSLDSHDGSVFDLFDEGISSQDIAIPGHSILRNSPGVIHAKT